MGESDFSKYFLHFDTFKQRHAFSILNHLDEMLTDSITKGNVERLYLLLERREKIADLIFSNNLELVFKNTDDYHLNGKKLGHTLSEASFCLLQSVDDFNLGLMLKFETFAGIKIQRAILQYLIKTQKCLIFNSLVIRLAYRIEQINTSFYNDFLRYPFIREIKENFDSDLKKDLEKTIGNFEEEKKIIIHIFLNKSFDEQEFEFKKTFKDIFIEEMMDSSPIVRMVMLDKQGCLENVRLSNEQIAKKHHLSIQDIIQMEAHFIKNIESKIENNVIIH